MGCVPQYCVEVAVGGVLEDGVRPALGESRSGKDACGHRLEIHRIQDQRHTKETLLGGRQHRRSHEDANYAHLTGRYETCNMYMDARVTYKRTDVRE